MTTSFLPTLTPSNSHFLSPSFTAPNRPAIKNRKGVRESLCLISLCGLNSIVGLSFTKIDTIEDSKHPLDPFNPFCIQI